MAIYLVLPKNILWLWKERFNAINIKQAYNVCHMNNKAIRVSRIKIQYLLILDKEEYVSNIEYLVIQGYTWYIIRTYIIHQVV